MRSSLGNAKKLSPSAGEYILPNSTLANQQLERWCWAAIAQGLTAYYHQNTIQQYEIASQVLGFDCSAYTDSTDVSERCNINYNLDKALEAVNCYSHWSPGKPFFERVQFEISMGRPVCLRINWFKGDAHYVMINGFNAANATLHIQDSLHGPSQIVYKHFPSKYRAGGVWAETYWTINKLSTQKTKNQ
ncbi:papain-like cysteine protease family protein [Mucilaginibacter celer]|nr:papain-like cysteine protease family protein [Mucilaginibacter celer]